jgi:hypothetical protein
MGPSETKSPSKVPQFRFINVPPKNNSPPAVLHPRLGAYFCSVTLFMGPYLPLSSILVVFFDLTWGSVRNSLSSVSSNGSPAYSILTFLGSGRIAHRSLFGTGFRILNISHCQGPSLAVTFRLLTTRGFPSSRTGVRLLRRLPSSSLRTIPAVRDGSALLSTLDSLLLSGFIVQRTRHSVNTFCAIFP